jgi:putative RNA 2'-phosphotransferase
MSSDILRAQVSRLASLWLRHQPEKAGLTLDDEGWADLSDLRAALLPHEIDISEELLAAWLKMDEKHRFEVAQGRVRARFGHSLPLQTLHPGKPPAQLYCGIPLCYVASTLKEGLKPRKRQHVHLTPHKRVAREAASNRGNTAAVVSIDAHAAFEAGVAFYPRGEGVWLSEAIAPQFLSLVEQGAKPQAAATSREARASAPGEPRRRRPAGGFNRRKRTNEAT